MIVVAMTNEDHRCPIGGWRKELFDRGRVRRDWRATTHPGGSEQLLVGHDVFRQLCKGLGSSRAEAGIAEERSRQQRVPTMLNEDAGNPKVGDGDQIARISAVRVRAPDSVRA
jgi:hypothetical protein